MGADPPVNSPQNHTQSKPPVVALRSRMEQTLGWLVIALLLAGCLLVLRPFISALIWAVVLCFSTWPLYCRVLKFVRNRRTIASLIMGLGMVCILLVPLIVVGSTVVDNVKDLTAAARRWIEAGPPAPPAWLAKVPAIGAKATEQWEVLAKDTSKLWASARGLIEPASAGLLKLGFMAASSLLEIGLSILVAFFFFRDGTALAERLTSAVDRIGGEPGRHLLNLAGKTIRGVVYGILGTAMAQAIMAGVGFLMAGVPGAGVLALLTFFLSVMPLVGPAVVWLPAAIWLFTQGASGWGIFMIIWGIGVNNLENVLKPILISRGSAMPFLLIFFGVLGGALAFGFIGVFIGPTLLAVGYRLVEEWGAAKRLALQAEAAAAARSETPTADSPISPSSKP
jgi:predicted PurR-regulated permease PerM